MLTMVMTVIAMMVFIVLGGDNIGRSLPLTQWTTFRTCTIMSVVALASTNRMRQLSALLPLSMLASTLELSPPTTRQVAAAVRYQYYSLYGNIAIDIFATIASSSIFCKHSHYQPQNIKNIYRNPGRGLQAAAGDTVQLLRGRATDRSDRGPAGRDRQRTDLVAGHYRSRWRVHGPDSQGMLVWFVGPMFAQCHTCITDDRS